MDNCKRGQETKDLRQLRRAHDHPEYRGEKESQSEVDQMVQEAEKSRDEDEVNESKHEAASGLEELCVVL